jgi:sugar phosphate isomerase/epimerase
MKTAGAVAAVACAGAPRLQAKELHMPRGVQLYCVRESLAKDFEGSLAKLASAGYQVVEAAHDYYNHTAAQFRAGVENAGMRCVSTHHSLGPLLDKGDELIEYCHKLGLKYIVCPGLRRRDPAAKGPLTLDDWRWAAGELNKVGEKVKAAGMIFGYHNHTTEFESEDGVFFFDELLRLTDPKLVVFEMDIGNGIETKKHPMEYLLKFPERFQLMHVKDVAKGANGEFQSVVLGRGVVDLHALLRAATGLKQYFVEQEEFGGSMDSFEALRLDAEYMRKFRF